MAKDNSSPRSYTLRLQSLDRSPPQWREHLWRTHAAINRGAKEFGDFLLTFCGGIDHQLADKRPQDDKLKEDKPKEWTPAERKDRRIILALSWLSVEDKKGAPDEKYRIVGSCEEALENILIKRGLSEDEITSWLEDCHESINAHIRDDAIWVNRSEMFDDLQKKWKIAITHDDLWDFLGRFLKESEYAVSKVTSDKKEKNDGDAGDEVKPELSDQSKDMAQAATGWLSNRFGSRDGANYEKLSDGYQRIADWMKRYLESITENSTSTWEQLFDSMANEVFRDCELASQNLQGILNYLSAPGQDRGTELLLKGIESNTVATKEDINKLQKKAADDTKNSKKKIGKKGNRGYATKICEMIETVTGVPYKSSNDNKERARLFEYCVMLDHAARKLISRLSWIKNAEVRRKEFEEKSKELDKVPEEAKIYLDCYCQKRTERSNAEDEYRIRRAAIGGWKEVLTAWRKCDSVEERRQFARDLQDNDNIEKFGDINLFIDLAEEEAKAVWGDFDSRILENYVEGTQAKYAQQRFKVPAYRHPDPLSHPVFCDFGNSRPCVDYSILEAFNDLSKSKPQKDKPKTKLRQVTLDLINAEDGSIEKAELRWQSKRLARDIGLGLFEKGELAESKTKIAEDVPRLDRFGRSRLSTDEKEKQTIAIYNDKNWNARLQISRDELNQIADMVKKEGANPFDQMTWPDKAKKLLRHVKWFISFSPKLHCPKVRKDLPPYHPKGKLIHYGDGRLRRCPGLRILSVDLGHRFGASCTVWEVVSKSEMEEFAKKTGQKLPGETDIFCFIEEEKKNDKGKTVTGKTIYRRIADDTVSNACWARLDRQFTIKLQGEESKPRNTTKEEKQEAEEFLRKIGAELTEKRKKNLNRIDSLLEELVRVMRLRLRCHGNLIKAARALHAETKVVSGNKEESLKTDEEKIESILLALCFLYDLRQIRNWNCSPIIESFWERVIAPSLTEQAKRIDKNATDKKSDTQENVQSPQQRKADRKKWDEAFRSVAVKLLTSPRDSWCEELKKIWQAEDGLLKVRMKELRRLVLPRPGKENKSNGKIKPAFRKKISWRGGLSVNRINMIRELYQVSKAFFMRPGGGNEKITKNDGRLKNYGKQILDTHERLRDNRVKQLVSRIVEAALGLGGGFEGKEKQKTEKSVTFFGSMRQYLDRKRDTKAPENRRFQPVHAIVIEDLDHYRPDQKQTRREARMLMQWSSGKVRDKLKEHCQLYGLFLMQVGAAYTSRFDSRTGKPGLRCIDVSVEEFMKENGFWSKKIQKIHEKKSALTHTDKLLLDLADHHKNQNDWSENKTIRIPQKGGDIFVAANGDNNGIQADLNAAANIGLRALTDYDCPLFFRKITCDSQGKLKNDMKEKSQLLKDAKDHIFLPTDNSDTEKKQTKGKTSKGEGIHNAWRDISCFPLVEGKWQHTKDYWDAIEKAVCNKLRCFNIREDETPF